MKKLDLRCYVCGKEISFSRFALVSPSTFTVDRVFVVHDEDCLADVAEDQASLIVGATARK